MEYLIIVLYSLYSGYRYSKNKKQKEPNKFLYWGLCLYCILLFGFRYRVGMDTLNYMDSYDYVEPLNKLRFEDLIGLKTAPLYGLLESFCKMISNEFYVMQLMVSTLFNIPLFWFIKKHSVNPFYSFLAFFVIAGFTFNTSIMRESLAVAVFLLNIDNLLNKKWIRYYLLCLVSIMFHYSALLALFFPIIMFLRVNYVFGGILVVFGVLQKTIGDFVLPYITYDIIVNRIEGFMELGESRTINWILLKVIQWTLIPSVLLVVGKENKFQSKFEPMACLYVLLGLGCIEYQLIFGRLAHYPFVPFVVFGMNFLYMYKNKMMKYVIIFMFLFSATLSMVKDRHYVTVYPYHSIFNPKIESEREYMRDLRFGNY